MSSAVVSGMIISAIPIVQMGFLYKVFWVPNAPQVDRVTCNCSCFDAVFKGSYEKHASRHGYKHVYFNATWQTMCIWGVSIVYILLGYEALKTFMSVLSSHSVRPIMAIVFCAGVYPHIYAWWALFNYYNDDFYPMFNHQVYFAVTEMISTYAILKSCDNTKDRHQWLYGVIVGTAIVHILVAGPEEFYINLFEGRAHQFWRDIGLASADFVNIILPVADIFKTYKPSAILVQSNQTTSCLKSLKWFVCFSRMKTVFLYCVVILILGYWI